VAALQLVLVRSSASALRARAEAGEFGPPAVTVSGSCAPAQPCQWAPYATSESVFEAAAVTAALSSRVAWAARVLTAWVAQPGQFTQQSATKEASCNKGFSTAVLQLARSSDRPVLDVDSPPGELKAAAFHKRALVLAALVLRLAPSYADNSKSAFPLPVSRICWRDLQQYCGIDARL
jgi:hypothetical protein